VKQRNGAGSKRLVEATERFIRSEQRLLDVLGDRRILKKAECQRFAKDLTHSAAKKRSSDVFASAISINKKVMGVLSKARSGAARPVSDSDVLVELSRITQSVGEATEAFREALIQIRAAVPYENATLFLMNRESSSLEEVVSIGERVDLIGHVRLGRGTGFSSWVAQQRKPVLLNDLHREGGADAVSFRSFLSVPILVQNESVGVINLSHSKPGAFDEESAARLGLLTMPIASVAIRTLLRRETERLATIDVLTTLYNKRHFDRSFEAELGKAKRYGHKVSVVVLDVDAHENRGRNGHAAADKILSDMAHLLKRSARGTDCVARYGSGEFRILLPHTDAERAKVAADRLRSVVEQHPYPRRRKPTIQMGITTYPVDPAQVLAQRAESAMEAVQQGIRTPALVESEPGDPTVN